MSEKMKACLLEYQQAVNGERAVLDERMRAKRGMDILCTKEKRSLTCRVNRIMRYAREGWSLSSTSVYVGVNHAERPMTCSIHAQVLLYFRSGLRSGELRLNCVWYEVGEMLSELREMVCGNGGVA